MALFYPVECIGDQEILNFRAAIVVNLGSPVRMLSLSWIRMLIYSGAVKIYKSMSVFREMCRYPVKDNADLILMEIIDHIFEILRCSVTGGRCIISGYLISPGTIKRMLRNSHKLYMSISHFFYISCQGLGKLTVIVKAVLIVLCPRMFLPGTRMYLIDRHRLFFFIKFLTVLDPCGIFPFIVCDIYDLRCSSRTHLSSIRIWVSLIQLFPVCPYNKKFIKLSDLRTRNKHFINTDRTCLCHRICFFIPVIELTNYRYRLCIRCPHCKMHTFSASVCSRMCTQFLIYLIIGSLSK